MSWMTIHTAFFHSREKKKKSKNQNTTHDQNGAVTGIIEIITIPLRNIILGSSKSKLKNLFQSILRA